ncbi:MAG: HMA2 domain-containing protein [Syntrophobacteraceae bacterium]|mgnify:CR=1 FL=1
MSYYLHDIPGRLRIRIPSLKGSASTAERVHDLLKTLCGVGEVTASTVTGSVVVLYDSESVSSREILDLLHEKGFFDVSRVVTSDQYVKTACSKAGQLVGKALFGLFVEKAFEGTPLALLTVLI